MRQNLTQLADIGADGRAYIAGDWYPGGIPSNVHYEPGVYLDTAYGFAAFHSQVKPAMQIGDGTGCYDRATFITGPTGTIQVGEFVILNGTTLISNEHISIGKHCMLAWGSVLCDSFWALDSVPVAANRRQLMQEIAQMAHRPFPSLGPSAPILLEDNCWVGFDALILPGVRLGQGCIVGCKAVVREAVPPYAVVVGNPARIIRYLEPDDTEEVRQAALQHCLSDPLTERRSNPEP
jgi:acetyltransferase-like isoleucine patch superfamily enzyme